MPEGASTSLKVVEKVAAREGTDPAELHPPLHIVVDTEALDALFRSTPSTDRATGTVEFEYQGYAVRVDSSGAVQIDEAISAAERTEPATRPAEDTIGD